MTNPESKKLNKEEWEEAASIYKTPHIRKEYIRKPAFMHELGDIHGKRMLDIGCGDGYYSRLMAEAGADVVGVDFSQEFINLAKKQEQKQPQGIHYFHGDIASMDFLPAGEVDGAVADFVFVTIPTQEKYVQAIKEVSRVLKQDGTVLISKGHPAKFNRPDKSKDYSLSYDKEPSYFDSLTPQHVKMNIEGEPVEWTNYHRSLEDFLNPWLENGFVITRVIEPKPTEEALKKFPEQLEGTDKLPYYVVFELKKTG